MGYKAFEPGMICRGKQYAENTVFEEAGADECCQAGVMHYCDEPFDCLGYCPLVNDKGEITEFAKVEPLAEVLKKDNKRASKKLRIGAKLSLKDIINAQVDVQMGKGNNETAASGDWSQLWSQLAASGDESQLAASSDRSKLAASGDRSKLAASGDGSQLAASGSWSKLAASGNRSKLAASGNRSQLAASGDWSQLAASGDESQLAASGDESQLAASGDESKLAASGSWSKLAASGDWSQLAASGDWSQLAASGDGSQLAASGAYSIAAAIGKNSMASAALGGWIVLAEYDEYNKPICVRAAQIDGEKLKPNVFYRLIGGEFVEVK